MLLCYIGSEINVFSIIVIQCTVNDLRFFHNKNYNKMVFDFVIFPSFCYFPDFKTVSKKIRSESDFVINLVFVMILL